MESRSALLLTACWVAERDHVRSHRRFVAAVPPEAPRTPSRRKQLDPASSLTRCRNPSRLRSFPRVVAFPHGCAPHFATLVAFCGAHFASPQYPSPLCHDARTVLTRVPKRRFARIKTTFPANRPLVFFRQCFLARDVQLLFPRDVFRRHTQGPTKVGPPTFFEFTVALPLTRRLLAGRTAGSEAPLFSFCCGLFLSASAVASRSQQRGVSEPLTTGCLLT